MFAVFRSLGGHADTLVEGRSLFANFAVEQFRLARVLVEEPDEYALCRALPGTARPGESEHFAVLDVRVETAERRWSAPEYAYRRFRT